MDEPTECFTKRKGPNAYVLFVTHFIHQYKSEHPNEPHRFHGGIPQAINDPLVVNAWENVSFDEKQYWKTKAREEKNRLLTEFNYHLNDYVNQIKDGGTGPQPNTNANGIDSNADPNGGGGAGAGGGGGASSSTESRVMAARPPYPPSLKRLLRQPKRRRNLEESKYAPTYFDDVSTAKQLEEKRRRDRNCLLEIWAWRSADDKTRILKESFFLVSCQSMGVRDDMHVPGAFACLEFSVLDGIKRKFCCTINETYCEWSDGALPDLYEHNDCDVGQSTAVLCREIFGEWVRSSRRDISSKTPVYFCLADEYAETLDCMTILFHQKDGTNARFPPYLLGTTDDLMTSLLHFFNVRLNSENNHSDEPPQASVSNVPSAPLKCQAAPVQLSRLIDQYFGELANVYACDSHRQNNVAPGEGELGDDSASAAGGGGDDGDTALMGVDRAQRCPMATVRACAAFAKKWIEAGHIDDRMLNYVRSPASVDMTTDEDQKSYAESIKSEDIDRFSYLNLSVGEGLDDRTVSSGSDQGAHHRRRPSMQDSQDSDDEESEESDDDVILIKSQQTRSAVSTESSSIAGTSGMNNGSNAVYSGATATAAKQAASSLGGQSLRSVTVIADGGSNQSFASGGSSRGSTVVRQPIRVQQSPSLPPAQQQGPSPIYYPPIVQSTSPIQYISPTYNRDQILEYMGFQSPMAVALAQPLPPVAQPSMPQHQQQQQPQPHADSGGGDSVVTFSGDFQEAYEAQKRLRSGCKGLGRGVRFDLSNAQRAAPGSMDLMIL